MSRADRSLARDETDDRMESDASVRLEPCIHDDAAESPPAAENVERLLGDVSSCTDRLRGLMRGPDMARHEFLLELTQLVQRMKQLCLTAGMVETAQVQEAIAPIISARDDVLYNRCDVSTAQAPVAAALKPLLNSARELADMSACAAGRRPDRHTANSPHASKAVSVRTLTDELRVCICSIHRIHPYARSLRQRAPVRTGPHSAERRGADERAADSGIGTRSSASLVPFTTRT